MRLYDILTELRKSPEQNVKHDTFDRIKEYSNDPSMCITFSTVDKVGVYPLSDWTTPNGVCAYPLDDFKKYLQDDWTREVWHKIFPYGNERPYAFILQITTDKILKMGQPISEEEFERCYKLIMTKWCKTQEDKMDCALLHNNFKGEEYTTSMLYRYILTSLGKLDSYGKKRTNIFNSILRELGYECIVDSGSGIIHENEPNQVVFLVPSAYKVVEKFYGPDLNRESRIALKNKR
jgi:hypothetical protein